MTRIISTSLAAIAALTLTACNQPEDVERPSVPDGAVAGDFSTVDCVYTARDVDYDAECSILIVPENRNDPDSRMIALPVTRVLALTDTPDEPVFWLTGGPGQSNMYLGHASYYLDNHDVVLTGYRGVDGSEYLACPEVDQALGGELMSQAGLERFGAAYRDCAERLTSEGLDTDGYTVLEVIDDVEAARVAIGYDRINLESASYGTRLALIYDWRYPGTVFRSAMVAVNPPGRFWWDPEILDSQIERYGELCAADDYCSSRTDDLAALMSRVARDMPERWLVFPVDADRVMFGTFLALYQTGSAAQVFDMWIAADEGDASGFALMTAAFDMMIPAEFAWGDSGAKALSTDYDFVPDHDYVAEVSPDPSIIGSPGNFLGWGSASGWPANKIPQEYRQAQPSSTRTLMLSGTLDVSTPFQTARDQLLPLMENAEQIVLTEAAHTGDLYYQNEDATQYLLTHFIDTGEIDGSGFTPTTVNFEASWGFPLIAKLALAAIGLGLVLTFFFLRFLFGLGKRR
jgi:pimeloyl-ACP methyl ester carboxylesterase